MLQGEEFKQRTSRKSCDTVIYEYQYRESTSADTCQRKINLNGDRRLIPNPHPRSCSQFLHDRKGQQAKPWYSAVLHNYQPNEFPETINKEQKLSD
jgi:hypothetical protein